MEQKKAKQKTIVKNDDLNLKDIIVIFSKNWKWFLLSVFLFISIGISYLSVKNPVYDVNAAILLKEDDNNSKASSVMSMLSGLGGDLGSMMDNSNVDNEIGVLSTRMMMREAVQKLNLNIVCKTKKGLKTVDMYPRFPYIISVDSAQVDTIKSAIKFKIIPVKNGQYEISGKYKSEKFKTVISGFPAIIKTPAIDVRIDKSPVYNLQKENQQVKVTIHNPNVMTYLLGKEVKIGTINRKTTIIGLGMATDNVKKAQDLLNTLIALFNKEATSDKNIEAHNTAAFVDERMAVISAELEAVEREVEKYKRENNLTDIESEAKLFLEQVSETEAKRIETQIQINMVQYLEDYIQNEKNKDKMIPAIGLEDKGLQAIILKYNELLIEKNSLESASSTTNQSLQMLNAQLASMRQNIISNVKNVKGSLNVIYQDLKGQDIVRNNRIKNIPRQEREFIEIARQREIKEKLYLFLLQKKEEVNLSLASTVLRAKTIDIPMPGIKPIAPKKLTILMAMLILGLGCPFAFFYLKQQLKTRIDSKEELERLCDAEIIGEISQSRSKEHIVVKQDSTSPEVELFRLLRVNVLFKIKGTDKKVILITSTIAGEGKTFIGTNLALSMAFTGKKVLLAGLDIRSPRLAEYLKFPKVSGISNYLSGEGLSPDDLIHKSGLHPNLEIVQAGTVPPNPNELLMEDALDELFKYYRTKYDYIVVDTAPVGIVSDTFLLDRLADVTLYVSRVGYVHKDSVKNINAIVEKDSLKNLYVVANGIDLGEKNGGYGYGYK